MQLSHREKEISTRDVDVLMRSYSEKQCYQHLPNGALKYFYFLQFFKSKSVGLHVMGF